MEEQLAYFAALMKNLNRIVPAQKRNQFHLIFGSRIIGTYKTSGEMIYADENNLSGLICVRYFPLDELSTRVQALWRGYHARYAPRTA